MRGLLCAELGKALGKEVGLEAGAALRLTGALLPPQPFWTKVRALLAAVIEAPDCAELGPVQALAWHVPGVLVYRLVVPGASAAVTHAFLIDDCGTRNAAPLPGTQWAGLHDDC